jgi:hypothetical protein
MEKLIEENNNNNIYNFNNNSFQKKPRMSLINSENQKQQKK